MAAIHDIRQDRPTPVFLRGLIALPQVSEIRATWARWQRRRSYRSNLKCLLKTGPHMIDDIGLTLEEARREFSKPFWRA
jgi:uncharacterized protein YjiS (DUF1127 family)